MKNRYSLVCLSHRGGMFYAYDAETKKRESLNTKDRGEAQRLLTARNEAAQHTTLNLQIAQVYLQHSDPALKSRTWAMLMKEVVAQKSGTTKERNEMAVKDKAFDSIRNKSLLATTAQDLFAVMAQGKVSTNIYLRRFHNFAVGIKWLPWPILTPRQWPEVRHKDKRAITAEEHQRILAKERNPEFKAFLQMLWHLGGSQSDVATLKAEDIDWESLTISYYRAKTAVPVVISFAEEAADILRSRPSKDFLFPWLALMHERHRAKLFYDRLKRLGITEVTFHSYRYSWAERAKMLGLPERFAQQALGHSSKACARAYSRNARVVVPALEKFESNVNHPISAKLDQ